jgi:DNA-binding response OmpR family regulator
MPPSRRRKTQKATGTDKHDVRPSVAIINTSPDTVNLLKPPLTRAGFRVSSAFTFDIRDGHIDVEGFLRVHQPDVVLYDIAPPYQDNWELLQQLRRTALAGYRLVLTTTNQARVEALVGRDEHVYEVVDKEGDLDVIIRATREALRARNTR